MVQDSIPFLANIVLVADESGTLSPSELGQLEIIRGELGFKKGDLTSALKVVKNGSHRLQKAGTFADQVKNLEAILRVAFADEDLDEKESSAIGDFAKMIGVFPEQLERLKLEVVEGMKKVAQLCPSCGESSEPTNKFCPKCGSNLVADKADLKGQFEYPKAGISIEFAESSAANFPKALQLAKESGSYQSCIREKKSWYLAHFPENGFQAAIPLADALSGIRNRKVYLDGQEKEWDEIFGFSWCARQRNSAFRPVEYCFGKDENRINPWGCKQARMDWTEWADWFCYGKWEKVGLLTKKFQFKFDKARIKHELATNLYRFRFCPYLKTEISEAVVKNLPDSVTPDSDPNWDYHQRYEELPGAIKVIEKENSDGYSFTREFWSSGVRPKSLKALENLLREALREVKGVEITADQIVKT